LHHQLQRLAIEARFRLKIQFFQTILGWTPVEILTKAAVPILVVQAICIIQQQITTGMSR